MLKHGFIPAISILVLIISINAQLDNTYSWVDETTAPIECADKCLENGIKYFQKGDSFYLPDECKQVCFGEDMNIVATRTAQEERGEQTQREQTARKQTQTEQTPEQKDEQAEAEERQEQENKSSVTAQEQIRNARQIRTEQSDSTKEDDSQANNTTRSSASANEIVRMVVEEKKDLNEGIMRKRAEVRLEEISGNLTANISANLIRIPGREISSVAKTISVRIRNQEIEIEQNEDSVSIVEDGVSARTEQVEIENGDIKISRIRIGILPAEMKEKIKGELKQLSIEKRNQDLVYNSQATRKAKFLGIFDVEYDVDSRYNAADGELISSNKPIWSILAFE